MGVVYEVNVRVAKGGGQRGLCDEIAWALAQSTVKVQPGVYSVRIEKQSEPKKLPENEVTHRIYSRGRTYVAYSESEAQGIRDTVGGVIKLAHESAPRLLTCHAELCRRQWFEGECKPAEDPGYYICPFCNKDTVGA